MSESIRERMLLKQVQEQEKVIANQYSMLENFRSQIRSLVAEKYRAEYLRKQQIIFIKKLQGRT